MRVSCRDLLHQSPAYARALERRPYKDVLQIADGRIVRHNPREANKLTIRVPGRHDKRGTSDRSGEQFWKPGIGGPPHRFVQRENFGIGKLVGCEDAERRHPTSVAWPCHLFMDITRNSDYGADENDPKVAQIEREHPLGESGASTF